MNPELTKEQQADIDARTEEFFKRYKENVLELEIDFVSYPQYVQTGQNMYSTFNGIHTVDKKYAPVPSPFTNEDGEVAEAE